MDVILFGPDRPQISFTQDPSGSMQFEFENDHVIYLDYEGTDLIGKDADDLDMVWADVYLSLHHNRDLVDLE